MESQPLWTGTTRTTTQFGIMSDPLSIAPSCASSHLQLCAQNCDKVSPPPTHTFLKRLFLTDFKKYTHTPIRNENLAHWTKTLENPEKLRICSMLAYSGCPRET